MSVAVTIAASGGQSYDPADNVTVAMTLPAGTTMLLALNLALDERGSQMGVPTFNGVLMTLGGKTGAGGLFGPSGAYYLLNPPTGVSYNLVQPWTGGTSYGVAGIGISGNNMGVPIAGFTGGASAANPSASIAAAANELVFMFCCGASATPGAGQTAAANYATSNTDLTTSYHYHSYKAGAGGLTTVSYTSAGSWWSAFKVQAPASGSQVMWVGFKRMQNFLRDLRAGLVPPQLLKQRYGDLVAI